MRKKLLLVCVFSILLVLIFSMCACNKDTSKLPTTYYEKVQFAFNGVTQTFSETVNKNNAIVDSYSNEDVSSLAFNSINIPTGISKVEAVYTKGDSQGDVIDELEYYQPPMIQFQCLKAILEKIGENYQFGEKYYNDMTGVIYFDMADGKAKDENNNYKYNYTFRLAMTINIDANDLITADVSFNIALTKDSQTYNTEWFVKMELDYDMTNTTPNYTLAMYTANDEHELSFRTGYTYEYDYVEVKDNKIDEWRKFVLETNQKLYKDSTHQEIGAFTTDSSFKIKPTTAKIYKNKNLRKITQNTQAKNLTLANAFYQDIGLNSTDIDSQPFVSKTGKTANEITELYSEMATIFKKDVIYSVVCVHEDSHGDEGGGDQIAVIDQIKVCVGDTSDSQGFDNQSLDRDSTMLEAMTQNDWANGTKSPKIFVHYTNNIEVKQGIDTLSDFTFSVQIGTETEVVVALNDKISAALASFNNSSAATSFKLTIKSQNDVSVTINCGIGNELKEAIQNANAKTAILTLGFPAFPDPTVTYTQEGNAYIIRNIPEDYEMNYEGELTHNGFAEVDVNKSFAKITTDNKLLYARIISSKDATVRRIELKLNEDVSATWNQELVDTTINNNKFSISAPTGTKVVYEYITTGDYKRVNVYGLTEEERDAYVASLASSTQFVSWSTTQSETRVLRVGDEDHDQFFELSLVYNSANLEISLSPVSLPIYRFSFKIGTGETQYFTTVDLSGNVSSGVSYWSDAITLKQSDEIYLYGTTENPIENISVIAGGEFEPYGSRLRYIGTSDMYCQINFFHYMYEPNEDRISVQFILAPDPSSPKS